MNNTSNKDKKSNIKSIPAKRPPGRPKGKKTEIVIKKLGIVDKPDDIGLISDNVIFQLSYHKPVIFQKIFNVYKKYHCSTLEFKFTKEILYIYSHDHNNKVIIFCKLYGKNMNKYYCKENVNMIFHALSLFKTFDGLSSNFTDINFIITNKYKKSKLLIIFSNETQTSQYLIDIYSNSCNMLVEENIIEYNNKEKNYPIYFNTGIKEMKLKLSELSNISPIIGIEQILIKKNNNIEKHILFKCSSDDSKLSNKSQFINNTHFNVFSSFDKPYFYIPVSIKNIKPFIDVVPNTKTTFYLDIDKELVITSNIDCETTDDNKEILGTQLCDIKIISNVIQSEEL